MELMQFDQVLEQSGENRCLLIGNGFNLNYAPKFKEFTIKEHIRKYLFNSFQYTDKGVEELMLEVSQNPGDVVKHLQQLFIEAIEKLHPGFSGEKINHCATFLKKFSRVYTLNYDLLLYWVINSDPELQGRLRDALGISPDKRGTYWPHKLTGLNPTTTYYLHGALHLYCQRDNNHDVCPCYPYLTPYCNLEKLAAESDTPPIENSVHKAPNLLDFRSALLLNVAKRIELNQYPHFVSEGDFEDKMRKIDSCRYLKGCYSALKQESDNLVILGASFDNDFHILDAIRSSNITKCFVGIFGDPNSESNLALRAKANILEADTRTVFFFDSKTTYVWQSRLQEIMSNHQRTL